MGLNKDIYIFLHKFNLVIMRKALEYISWTGLSISCMLLGASAVHNYYKPDLTIKIKQTKTTGTAAISTTTTTNDKR